jgi:hypothetical protein
MYFLPNVKYIAIICSAIELNTLIVHFHWLSITPDFATRLRITGVYRISRSLDLKSKLKLREANAFFDEILYHSRRIAPAAAISLPSLSVRA